MLHGALAPYAHLYLVDGIGAGLMGSVERPLGNLAMLAGDLDGAAAHFERALEANVDIGAPLALANVRREYAELLRRRDGPGDAQRRDDLLREADAFYRAAGIPERVTGTIPPPPEDVGRWERTGAGWPVTFRGRSAALPAVKGMADLARLLAQPDHEVHVLDLVGTAPGDVPSAGRSR